MHNGAESMGSSNTPVCSNRPKNRDSTTYNLLPTTYQKGFTIVELLVVIVVIGILAAITIVSYTGISNKAVSSSIQSDLANASNQLKLYQVINSAYPTSVTDCPSPAAANICLKNSPGNNVAYQADNISSPQTFNLKIANNNTRYYITNDSAPIAYTPVTATGGTITDVGNYRIHTFTTGDSFSVTAGGTVSLYVWGGGGGGSRSSGVGGGGGSANGTMSVNSGSSYTIVAGGGGLSMANGSNSGPAVTGGGGLAPSSGYSGQGGGYSGIFNGSASQASALLMAGGGGGGGFVANGGAGGGSTGIVGSGSLFGEAGTQLIGGNGGYYGAVSPYQGTALQGGSPANGGDSGGGGGGGGGYWGGGAGFNGDSPAGNSGGGGGSGYYNPSFITSANLIAGSGATAGDSGNSLRGTAGNGGAVSTAGNGGVVVIRYLLP